MSDKQALGIMAAMIFNRLVELEDWSIEDSIKEAVHTAHELMAGVSSQPNHGMPK